MFTQGSTYPVLLWNTVGPDWLVYRAFTFFGSVFQTDSISPHISTFGSKTPKNKFSGLG